MLQLGKRFLIYYQGFLFSILQIINNNMSNENITTKMKTFKMSDVSTHGEFADTQWIVIEGKVIDVTKYQKEHPGGRDILLENAGKDATEVFENTGHSDEAKDQLQKFIIGVIEGMENIEPKVLKKVGKNEHGVSGVVAGSSGAANNGINYLLMLTIPIVIAIIIYFYFAK